MTETSPGSSGLDRMPFHRWAHLHSSPQLRHATYSKMHTCMMWEETGVSRENPGRHELNMQLHRHKHRGPGPDRIFFLLINIITNDLEPKEVNPGPAVVCKLPFVNIETE